MFGTNENVHYLSFNWFYILSCISRHLHFEYSNVNHSYLCSCFVFVLSECRFILFSDRADLKDKVC